MSWQPIQPPPPPSASSKDTNSGKQNYYQLLQVTPTANLTVIRYAYRYLAAMYHPDNTETADVDKFKLITEAWRVLSDSNKRNLYDMQLGAGKQTEATTPANSTSTASNNTSRKPSIAWSEIDLRLAVLQILMEARRKKPQGGGASAKMLMDCLGVEINELEYIIWYLREKRYIDREEAQFTITISGVDYLIDQLSRTQPLDGSSPSPVVNLRNTDLLPG
jgi:curved DNA-binding protein